MKDSDIKFFKMIAVIICIAICIGIGGYFVINHESPREKQDRLMNQMEKDQKDLDTLESKVK